MSNTDITVKLESIINTEVGKQLKDIRCTHISTHSTGKRQVNTVWHDKVSCIIWVNIGIVTVNTYRQLCDSPIKFLNSTEVTLSTTVSSGKFVILGLIYW